MMYLYQVDSSGRAKFIAANSLSLLLTEEIDGSDIDDIVPVIAVTTYAQLKLNDITDASPKNYNRYQGTKFTNTLRTTVSKKHGCSMSQNLIYSGSTLLIIQNTRNWIFEETINHKWRQAKSLAKIHLSYDFTIGPPFGLSLINQVSIIGTVDFKTNISSPLCSRSYESLSDTKKNYRFSTQFNYERQLHLRSKSCSLEWVGIDNFGLYHKTSHASNILIVLLSGNVN